MEAKINVCGACGCEQQLVDVDEFFCERCGAKNYDDGSYEYDGSREGIEKAEEKMKRYDNGVYHRTGLDWLR